MKRYQTVICVLLPLGFLLYFAGTIALEAQWPVLGVILGGSGILSFLLIPWVLHKEEQRRKEEEDQRRYP